MTDSIATEERREPQEDVSLQREYMDRKAHSMSIDSGDALSTELGHPAFRQKLPPSPYATTTAPRQFVAPRQIHVAYPPPSFPSQTRTPPRHLQAVVTTSFSVEEEREDLSRKFIGGRGGYASVQRFEGDDRFRDVDEREAWEPSNVNGRDLSPDFPIPSPKKASMHGRPFMQRAYSSSGYFVPPMKRSFYHHSRPTNQYSSQLPPDFMPPKRVKTAEPPRKEIIASPRNDSDSGGTDTEWMGSQKPHYLHRAQSYPSPPAWTAQDYQPPSAVAYSSPPGAPPKKYIQVSPGSEHKESPRSWNPSPSGQWSASSPSHSVRFWDSPRNRDEAASERAWDSPREYDQIREAEMQTRASYDPTYGSTVELHSPVPVTNGKIRLLEEAADLQADKQTVFPVPRDSTGKPLLLLALPQDRIALSETLCVVRENIEVFEATQNDVDAPAPGRKHAVVVGQVGLRCIHCRYTTKCSDRVKRAVCYPSSIKRIYRTVIDMKLDHFSQCKYVPISLKERLDKLKAIHTRSTGTTMQYFIHAAHTLGMEDGDCGVILRETEPANSTLRATCALREEMQGPSDTRSETTSAHQSNDSLASGSWSGSAARRTDSMSMDSYDAPGSMSPKQSPISLDKYYEGLVPLSLPEDKTALSPLRCFLREQVCAFSATEKDIAVRAPTTFSIQIGQVGIGCIHCVRQASKGRSNRAVCFPFSIGRIYQSVADIQRFHFGECKMMPPEVKEKFHSLQSASSKGSKGLATRQYWVTSAKKIGLVDTPEGIRFGRDPSKPLSTQAFSLDILAQVAFSVTTASKQLVLPEDKPCIAEFLYVVMEQLQPCRFTEADRNKRRLKDVGCIGVECKHCAGQVDSRKFFWSSVSAVESNFVSVHTHMLECKMVPQSLKERLIELKKLRKEQTAALKTGSQKAFFARVWRRLHEEEHGGEQEPFQTIVQERDEDVEPPPVVPV